MAFEVVLRTVPSNRIICSGPRSPARNTHNWDQFKNEAKNIYILLNESWNHEVQLF